MAGLIVSASTGAMRPLLGKLATLMGEEFTKLKNLQKEVKFISEELTSMKDALERLSDLDGLDKQTKGWRDQVREMSYDIEDIIDDFMRRIGEKSETDGFGRKTARLLRKLRARHQIASRIKEIRTLVLETTARRQRYKLDISPSSNMAIDPRVSALYKNAASLVGVEGPTNELVNLLVDEEKQLKVVSIVGFGGLGKTTLANVVYGKLKGDFSSSAFVPVSQKPNIPKLLRSLLSQLAIEPSIHACESQLIDSLREHLENERYLIIIDDIWDVSAWDIIKCAFPENDLGSRVIVTTRIQGVAATCCSHRCDYILQLKPLSNKDSIRLFFGRIFGSDEACPHHLKDVSIEILKKCCGLPLAIISISGLLASEGSSQEEWENVRNLLGSMSGTKLSLEGMRQILNLSYKDLLCHLKTCLLYIGMYPEDYTIERYDLECQWMAEGFICQENAQDVAKAARNYFNELVNRSLIQPVESDNRGSVTQCKVHDMMLDPILLKSAEHNFFTILSDPQVITGLDYKVCRLSVHLDGAFNGRTVLPRNISLSQVQSVMLFKSSQNTPCLLGFKFLQVDLTGLCKLYQLRYLGIGCLCPHELPAHIRMLQHLQTLGLFDCTSLPSDIVHLPNLLHLNVDTELPDGIGNMKSLRHVCFFDFSVNTLDNIKDLGELTNLRYLFLGCGPPPDDRERSMDALCFSLGRLYNLEDLIIELTGCMDGLMPFSPPPTPYRLESLLVSSNCLFSWVPMWMAELRVKLVSC